MVRPYKIASSKFLSLKKIAVNLLSVKPIVNRLLPCLPREKKKNQGVEGVDSLKVKLSVLPGFIGKKRQLFPAPGYLYI